MERTSSAIKVWFWPRNGGGAPSEITSGSGSINPDNWGAFGVPTYGLWQTTDGRKHRNTNGKLQQQ